MMSGNALLLNAVPLVNDQTLQNGLPTIARGIVIISGGSAANSLVDVFNDIKDKRQSPLSYIIPISDNGGSSSELIRVFGGPGIGDIRSRLVRLIPPSHAHIYALLNHRLSSSPDLALSDFQALVSGTSPLWPPIAPPAREVLRSMLNHLHFEILKRARPPHSTFNFSSASIGNLFLTGARLFTGSFESAIYLVSLIGGVPATTAVIPAINSNFSHHIAAGLEDGSSIIGQNAISHPSAPTALPDRTHQELGAAAGEDDAEDANLPGSLPTLRQSAIAFSKVNEEELSARIDRLWYINPYGQEIPVSANPKAVSVLKGAEALIYSIGSLYTSIVPCLILRGVGDAIVGTPGLRHKILVLNGSLDRETGPKDKALRAVDFVRVLVKAGEQSRGNMMEPGEDDEWLWRKYVTHVLYVEGPGTPAVDRELLGMAGVECVRCWGRKASDGSMRFDERGLKGALEAVLGKGDRGGSRSRRNTMESYVIG